MRFINHKQIQCLVASGLGTPEQICNHVRLMLHYRLRKYGKPSPSQVKATFEQISNISRMDYDRIQAYLEMFQNEP